MSELPVQDIQQALAQRGYSIGSIDGLWGRRSINALAAFQKAEGLPATGELDPATVSRLLPPNSNVSTVLPDYGSPDALPPSSETIDTRPDEAEAVDHPAAGSTSPAAEASLPATEAPPPQDRKTDAAPNTSRSSDSPPPPLSVPQSTRSPDTGLIVLALVVVVGLLWVMRRRGTKGKHVRAPTVVAAGPGNHVGRSQTVAPLVPASLRASLDAHNAAVDRAVRERGQSHARSASPPIPARSVPPPPASANTSKAAPSSACVA
ncbi:MAG: peptidoglycan-binding protein, partial [Rhizobiales bacterium]|nr:peptidoglycan-binding protein [Hyphomicrobiales bacterium]